MSQCTPRNRVADLFPAQLAEVDALFNHFFTPAGARRAARSGWLAPASVWESEGRIHLDLDAPGVTPEGVEVTYDRGQLTIQLERADARANGNTPPAYVYNERGFGKLSRSITLPDTVDPESIEANLAQGVLRVSIAKRPEAQPRRIDVRAN